MTRRRNNGQSRWHPRKSDARRETLPDRIDRALKQAGGRMSYFDLAVALWPDRSSWNYSSNGGPPGCYMTLSAALRRGGFYVSGESGAGNRTVHARSGK